MSTSNLAGVYEMDCEARDGLLRKEALVKENLVLGFTFLALSPSPFSTRGDAELPRQRYESESGSLSRVRSLG